MLGHKYKWTEEKRTKSVGPTYGVPKIMVILSVDTIPMDLMAIYLNLGPDPFS